jgi:phage-related protein
MKNIIAFKGEKYTIEWFVDAKGYSQAMEYFEEASQSQKNKTMYLFSGMANFGKIWDITKFRNEGDGIYAFKPDQDRYLCFFVRNGKIIVTNAFMKKSQKMPKKEKEKALVAYKNYIKRELL